MTATGKSTKQPLRLLQLVWILVFFLVVSEVWLQRQHQQLGVNRKACSSSATLTGIPRGDSATRIPILANSPTVHDAFARDNVLHWDNVTELAPAELKTHIETSDDDEKVRYGLSPLRDVCVRPNGTIVVVGLSREEFSRGMSEAMAEEWKGSYNCSWGCNGAAFEKVTPKGALWITGTTTHIVPHLGNVFHHFAERVWPHLTSENVASQYYYVHRMNNWLDQAHHSIDRNTLMFQIALLAGNAEFLQHTDDERRPLCFERLVLCSSTAGRMSPKLGLDVFGPAIMRYREAAFKYFAIPKPPEVCVPPSRLRVTLYGRSDASRRRIPNIAQVAEMLRNSTYPPLFVTVVDDLMEQGLYNQTLPEVVSLMAQTDVYITPHGANTWATLFMPQRAAVIEIYGPCGPSTWIAETIVPALQLKHETQGNPWGARVASPQAGNTTECRGALDTPDFTIDRVKLREAMKRLRVVDEPGDRLPLHWLFNWKRNSYQGSG